MRIRIHNTAYSTSFPYFLEKPVERCSSLSQLPGACALEDHRHSLRGLDAEFTATSSRRPRLLLRVLAKSKTRTKINQNSSWFVLSSALTIKVLYESFFSILSPRLQICKK
jgi:hypothetical protein